MSAVDILVERAPDRIYPSIGLTMRAVTTYLVSISWVAVNRFQYYPNIALRLHRPGCRQVSGFSIAIRIEKATHDKIAAEVRRTNFPL
jgi:hypothetical protein